VTVADVIELRVFQLAFGFWVLGACFKWASWLGAGEAHDLLQLKLQKRFLANFGGIFLIHHPIG
jgi:hypothetical protein